MGLAIPRHWELSIMTASEATRLDAAALARTDALDALCAFVNLMLVKEHQGITPPGYRLVLVISNAAANDLDDLARSALAMLCGAHGGGPANTGVEVTPQSIVTYLERFASGFLGMAKPLLKGRPEATAIRSALENVSEDKVVAWARTIAKFDRIGWEAELGIVDGKYPKPRRRWPF